MAGNRDIEPSATGIEAAVLLDLLLELGVDVDEALTWAPEKQIRFVEEAISRGDITDARAMGLRELGVLPPR